MRPPPPKPPFLDSEPATPPEDSEVGADWIAHIPRGLAALLFIFALGAAFWRIPPAAAPGFAPPPDALHSPRPALFSSVLLPPSKAPAEPTLTLLPNGRLAAAWSADSQDDAEGRSIWLSIEEADGWRPPLRIASRESTAAGTLTHAGGLGKPLLHAEGSWLHLWYTSRDGLAGDSLNHGISTNDGQAWTKPGKLEISPLTGGELQPGGPPVILDDGGLGLLLSRSFISGHSSWLRLSATGQILGLQRLPAGQPVAASALDTRRAVAVHRDPATGQLQLLSTDDGGQSWQAGDQLPVTIADGRPALLRLASGRLLLAANPAAGRASLQLWLATDDGRNWLLSRSVEAATDGPAEFSEPALLLGRDGRIHLAYRWRQQAIKLVSFSEAWLDGGSP
ncbi:MAG: exo-alpha-sialidase [Azonexus sp.]